VFNNQRELMQSMGLAGEVSAYEYFSGQLAAIHHENHPTLSFEYEGKNVVSINRLSNKIHLEYDKRGLLCRIFDQQGASLSFSYYEHEGDDEDGKLEDIADEAGTICSIYGSFGEKGYRNSEISLLFNGHGEVIYYKTPQNTWKFAYRGWDFEKDLDE